MSRSSMRQRFSQICSRSTIADPDHSQKRKAFCQHRVVLLEPDVAEAFPDSASVNEALS